MEENPTIIKNPDTSDLVRLLKEYIEFVYSEDFYEDSDYEEYIFEEVMMTFFGQDIFERMKERYA